MPPKPINSNILYVGLVPYEWDEETVKSVVCGSGNIVDVRLQYDFQGKTEDIVLLNTKPLVMLKTQHLCWAR